jgi:hypothetical protein
LKKLHLNGNSPFLRLFLLKWKKREVIPPKVAKVHFWDGLKIPKTDFRKIFLSGFLLFGKGSPLGANWHRTKAV